MRKKENFKENFIWNIIGTTANAFNSLFFMIAITRINGLEDAGIFTIAFSTACILYVVGIYAGRIYQVTDSNKEISDCDYIFNRLISSITVIVLTILFVIMKGYDIYKSAIFIALGSYKALEAFSEVFYGILQKNELLSVVGKSSFIKALISLCAFVSIDLITKNILMASISISIIYIVVMLMYDYRKIKSLIEIKKYDNKKVLSIFKSGFYTFAISFLGLYVMNAPKYAIDKYLTEDMQAIFGIIIMPATVMGLVAQFLIHPYLNTILDAYEKREVNKFYKVLKLLILCVSIVGIISACFAFGIGTEILGIIYGIDLGAYRIDLLFIIIASILYTIGVIYSSILTTIRDTFSQFIIYICITIFSFVISNCFTKVGKINGATSAYFIIMLMLFIIYFIYTNIKIKKIFREVKMLDCKK